jgi:hypothetical protein
MAGKPDILEFSPSGSLPRNKPGTWRFYVREG